MYLCRKSKRKTPILKERTSPCQIKVGAASMCSKKTTKMWVCANRRFCFCTVLARRVPFKCHSLTRNLFVRKAGLDLFFGSKSKGLPGVFPNGLSFVQQEPSWFWQTGKQKVCNSLFLWSCWYLTFALMKYILFINCDGSSFDGNTFLMQTLTSVCFKPWTWTCWLADRSRDTSSPKAMERT